ncbi:hypothetical protein Hanom_Chr09g00826531 [Helianthus anomalus]
MQDNGNVGLRLLPGRIGYRVTWDWEHVTFPPARMILVLKDKLFSFSAQYFSSQLAEVRS